MNIRDAIHDITKQYAGPVYSLICVVDSVDEAQRTCSVSPVNGDAPIDEVRLQAQIGASQVAHLVIPKVGSYVIVSMISEHAGYVSMFSEIERIDLAGNDDDMEPLVKGEALNDNLDDLTDKVIDLANDLVTFGNTQAAAAAGALAPLAPGYATLAAAATALASAATALKANYTNHISMKSYTE